jgi:hypothetical protein
MHALQVRTSTGNHSAIVETLLAWPIVTRYYLYGWLLRISLDGYIELVSSKCTMMSCIPDRRWAAVESSMPELGGAMWLLQMRANLAAVSLFISR